MLPTESQSDEVIQELTYPVGDDPQHIKRSQRIARVLEPMISTFKLKNLNGRKPSYVLGIPGGISRASDHKTRFRYVSQSGPN